MRWKRTVVPEVCLRSLGYLSEHVGRIQEELIWIQKLWEDRNVWGESPSLPELATSLWLLSSPRKALTALSLDLHFLHISPCVHPSCPPHGICPLFWHVWLFFLAKTGFSNYSELLQWQMLGFQAQWSVMYKNSDFCRYFENGIMEFCGKQVVTKPHTIECQISSFSPRLNWTITFFPSETTVWSLTGNLTVFTFALY